MAQSRCQHHLAARETSTMNRFVLGFAPLPAASQHLSSYRKPQSFRRRTVRRNRHGSELH
ncbi:MAG: hypothetical protein JWO91_3542 [Acidobacteriaceae bacterium]|nr:hypothetical protein [Acidobacteriaceae bacterium]